MMVVVLVEDVHVHVGFTPLGRMQMAKRRLEYAAPLPRYDAFDASCRVGGKKIKRLQFTTANTR